MSDVLDLLHPVLRTSVEKLRERFVTARPFRHVFIDHFWRRPFCERLIAESHPSTSATPETKWGKPAVRLWCQRWAGSVRPIQSSTGLCGRKYSETGAEVTAISGLLYDPEYAGGGTHENLDGQELDWHVDFYYHPTSPLHRRLNLILFLNPEWNKEWGGCLELHRDPWHSDGIPGNFAVLPLANTCVIFETTENSWHGFERIRLPKDGHFRSRRSIAVYFYSKTRPAAETAPPTGPFMSHAACRRSLHLDIHYVRSTSRTSRSYSRRVTARFDTYTTASSIFPEP